MVAFSQQEMATRLALGASRQPLFGQLLTEDLLLSALGGLASAAVLADAHSSTLVNFGIYTLATGVSVTRVLGQQHFPSDVLVGSAAGWIMGHYIYRTRHRH